MEHTVGFLLLYYYIAFITLCCNMDTVNESDVGSWLYSRLAVRSSSDVFSVSELSFMAA